MKKVVYNELNLLKGLAIILVIIGHSFPDTITGVSNPINLFIFAFIYLFHMPLFFFISGILLYKKEKKLNNYKERILEVKNKFLRLMIPYFFFSIITLILKISFSSYASNKFDFSDAYKVLFGVSSNGGLWFLYILFVVNIVVLLIPSNKNIKYYLLLIISFIIVYLLRNTNSITIYRIIYHLPYFLLGIITSIKYEEFKNNTNKNLICLILLTSFMAIDVYKGGYLDIYAFLLGMSGIVASFIIVSFIKNGSIIDKILNLFGKYSMQIYLLSYYFLIPIRIICKKILIPYYLTMAILIIIGLLMPIVISKYIIRDNKYINVILFGQKKKIE